jgi:hypothetical protein
MFYMCRLLVLSIFVAVTYMMTWSIVPRFLKLMIQLSSQVRPIVMFHFFLGLSLAFLCIDP